MASQYPTSQKNVQALARYRCADGHVFEVIRTRALSGYNPELECPEPPVRPLFVGDVCRKPAHRVGEGGFWPVRIADRDKLRKANRERGYKSFPVYRRVGGYLKLTGGL